MRERTSPENAEASARSMEYAFPTAAGLVLS